jgi:hypothetical protein
MASLPSVAQRLCKATAILLSVFSPVRPLFSKVASDENRRKRKCFPEYGGAQAVMAGVECAWYRGHTTSLDWMEKEIRDEPGEP